MKNARIYYAANPGRQLYSRDSKYLFIPVPGHPGCVQIALWPLSYNTLNSALLQAVPNTLQVGKVPLGSNSNDKSTLWRVQSVASPKTDQSTPYYTIQNIESGNYLNGKYEYGDEPPMLNLVNEPAQGDTNHLWRLTSNFYLKKAGMKFPVGSCSWQFNYLCFESGEIYAFTNYAFQASSAFEIEAPNNLDYFSNAPISLIAYPDSQNSGYMYWREEKRVELSERPVTKWTYDEQGIQVSGSNGQYLQPGREVYIREDTFTGFVTDQNPINGSFFMSYYPYMIEAGKAVETAGLGEMAVEHLQALEMHFSPAQLCFVQGDGKKLQLIYQNKAESGFVVKTIQDNKQGVFGYCLVEQTLFYMQGQCLAALDVMLNVTKPNHLSCPLGTSNTFSAPVYDQDSDYILVLRDDGSVYAFRSDFSNLDQPIAYTAQAGETPAERLELYLENKNGATQVCFQMNNYSILCLELNPTQQTLQKTGTINEYSAEIWPLQKSYETRALRLSSSDKGFNTWSSTSPFRPGCQAFVLDGLQQDKPFVAFIEEDTVLKESRITLMIHREDATMPRFSISSGKVTSGNLTDLSFLSSTLILKDGEGQGQNLRLMGCPRIVWNQQLEQFDVYGCCSNYNSPETVTFARFSLNEPDTPNYHFVNSLDFLGGKLSGFLEPGYWNKYTKISNSLSHSLESLISGIAEANSPIGLLYQKELLQNFDYSALLEDDTSNSLFDTSLLEQWFIYSCISGNVS